MTFRAAVVAATLLGCGERDRHTDPASVVLPLARGLAVEVGARLGVPVIARCRGILGMPTACDIALPEGGLLALHLHYGTAGWDWNLDGLVITTDAIVEYVRREIEELVSGPIAIVCAPRIRQVSRGDRVECKVGVGGKAFVTIDDDGGIATLEVVLDPAAAAARSEEVSQERADGLDQMSRALAVDPTDDDDDESDRDTPPGDAGLGDAKPAEAASSREPQTDPPRATAKRIR